MESNATPVKYVTIGAGWNDLSAINKFNCLDKRLMDLPDDYVGYTDAKDIQYIIPFKERTKENQELDK